MSIKTFNGSQEMSFVTPMLFISFESISPATLEMMTYLRNRLGFTFIEGHLSFSETKQPISDNSPL